MSIRMSIRLPRGIVTSLVLKKNIVALWLLYKPDSVSANDGVSQTPVSACPAKYVSILNDFVYKAMDEWNKDTGKGLSEFITERLLKDFLQESPEDYKEYLDILKNLNKE